MANDKVIHMDLAAQLKQAQEQIAALNAKLAAKNNAKITLKVSEKGALSAYGLGRFPITLYRSQWEKLLAEASNIKAFISAHGDELTTKD